VTGLRFIAFVFFLFLGLLRSGVSATETPEELLRPLSGKAREQAARPADPAGLMVLRRQTWEVNSAALVGRPVISVAPFADRRFLVTRTRVSESADGKTLLWFGSAAGERPGGMVLAATGEVISGSLHLATGEFFELRPAGPGLVEAREVAYEETSSPEDVRTVSLPATPPPLSHAAGTTQIDVMILYTAAARQAAGGETAIQNKIQLAVAEINQSYQNSGIPIEMRLVHTREVVYNESSGIDQALSQLTDKTDGVLDEAHAWRNQYGADLVQLWIHGPGAGGGVVGLAWLMSPPSSWFSEYGFSVVEQNFAAGPYFTSGHEFGHNQGAHHNRANASGPGAYPYSYGYQLSGVAYPFRTIMSYSCPTYCPKINYWSNPEVLYQNQPIGKPEGDPAAADNRATLTNTRSYVAAFRAAAPPPAPQPPVPGTISPSSGNGAAQTFVAAYTDANGAADITGAYLLVNSQIRADQGCFLHYNRAAGTFQLLHDSGQWSSPAAAGSGTLANSRCVLNLAGAGASASGNTLTVTFPLTFTNQFAGAQNLYLLAIDASGHNSNWSLKGSWTVPVGPSPPVPGTVTPASGTGASALFTATYTDANGATDIVGAYLMVHAQIRPDAGCFVYYHRPGNTVYLLNDAGTAWSAGVPAGAGSLANNACTVNTASLTASANGNTLTVTFPLTFGPAFAGTKNVYLLAIDAAGQNSNWSAKGVWTIPAANQPPVPGTISPASGSGASQTFTATYSDANGAADIVGAYLLVHSQIRPDGGCFVFYNRPANTVQLVNDAGTLWSAPVTAGAGSVANSFCTVQAAGVSASTSGNVLTLVIPLSFTAAFGGEKNLYLLAIDSAGANSNWSLKGTWTAPLGPRTPTPLSVSPNAGTGLSQTFTAIYSDANGATDIVGAYFLFHSQIRPDGGCFVYYNRAANTVQLANDAGMLWSAPIPAGSGTLANSQCTISGVGVSGSASGDTLTVTLPVTFSPMFAGTKNIYLLAIDASGANSNWHLKGTWVVP
jgi:hypothetical protein